MAGKQRYSATEVIAALEATKGGIYLAAQRLGCDPETVKNYCKRYPSVQAACEAKRGQMIDLAEQKLWQSIKKGEAWGVAFCLKTLGKERGYVERTETTGKDGGPQQHEFLTQAQRQERIQELLAKRNGHVESD